MGFLKNITIRIILLTILGAFLALWAGASIFTSTSLSSMTSLLETNETQRKNLDVLVEGNDQYFRTVTRLLRSIDYQQTGETTEADKVFTSATAAFKITSARLAEFKTAKHVGVDTKTVDDMAAAWTQLLDNALTPMLNAAHENRQDEFRQLFRKTYPPLSVAFGSNMNKYNTAIYSSSKVSMSKVYSLVDWSNYILLSAVIIGIIILLLTDRYLSHYLVKPLNMLKGYFKVLADGQLNYPINEFGRNCVGQLIPYLKEMQGSLVNTVSIIRDSSASIHQGSSEIRSGNSDLSARTEQQAAALEQTAASMEQLNATVQQNTDNVHQATNFAKDASIAAKKGGKRHPM